jgi:hypothetical protein
MVEHRLDAHLGREVAIDLCEPCQALWFDARENLQLTPGATLALFRVIGEHVTRPQSPVGDAARCPRCRVRLQRTRDMQRATRFEYYRCPKGHGRLTTFFDFLKEKDFVRPLTPPQIAELRRKVQTVNCSNCGAPIDLARGSECPHCASPLSMLDMDQAGTLIAQLREAERTDKTVDPALPLELARARRQAEEAFRNVPRTDVWTPGDLWLKEGTTFGLVGAGLTALVRKLRGE